MTAKNTAEMENEILQVKTEGELQNFLDENKKNLPDLTLAEYLEILLKEKNLSKVDVIKKSCIGNYAYKIFSGERKNNSRTKILSLALAMQLSLNETQRLLYYAESPKLYAKDTWDDVIIFALNNGYDVERTNQLLTDSVLKPLLGDF